MGAMPLRLIIPDLGCFLGASSAAVGDRADTHLDMGRRARTSGSVGYLGSNQQRRVLSSVPISDTTFSELLLGVGTGLSPSFVHVSSWSL